MSLGNDEWTLIEVGAQIVFGAEESLCRAGATIGFIALARSAGVASLLSAAVELCADSNRRLDIAPSKVA